MTTSNLHPVLAAKMQLVRSTTVPMSMIAKFFARGGTVKQIPMVRRQRDISAAAARKRIAENPALNRFAFGR